MPFLNTTSGFFQMHLVSAEIQSTAKNMCVEERPNFSIQQRLLILSLAKYKLTQQL